MDVVGNCCDLQRVFDRDGNGYITRDELQIAMEMMQENVTETQVNEMLQLADLDKDGKINYEGMQFYNHMENQIVCKKNLWFRIFQNLCDFYYEPTFFVFLTI